MLTNRVILIALFTSLVGCASIKNDNEMGATKPATASDTKRAAAKIAFAIGRDVNDFTITAQQQGEAPGGFTRTNYSLTTTDGASYSCYVLEPSGLGKAMSFGMASGTDAVCNEITSHSNRSPKPLNNNCNDLLRAAKKC